MWGEGVERSKFKGVKYFKDQGYHVFAVIDNEPENLAAISEIYNNKEVLLMHADTIFKSKRTSRSSGWLDGKNYDVKEFMLKEKLPEHIQFVWHGVNDRETLKQFLLSDIHWGEIDVRLDRVSEQLIIRKDSFEEKPPAFNEDYILLDDFLARFSNKGKGVKLDIKEGGEILERILKILKNYSFDINNIWFNAGINTLTGNEFINLSNKYKGSIIQCPADFLVPTIIATPEKAVDILLTLRSWGVNRFSLNWATSDKRKVMDFMEENGCQVNLYDVSDLENFIKAILLMPRSVTSDLDLQDWNISEASGLRDCSVWMYGFASGI